MNKEISDRIASEREFHNSRFSDPLDRPNASKYYLALEFWYRDYLSCIESSEARNILEVGSGIESLALQLQSAGFELSSIDISEEAIAFARQNARLPQAVFSVDDAHHMTFATNSFDLVVGRGILHHLDLSLACSELKRVLKPGGNIIFGEPLDCNFLINIYRKMTPKIRSRDEQPLTNQALRLICSKFEGVEITYYGFLTLGPAIFGLKSPLFLHRLDSYILNSLGLGPYFAWACLIRTSGSCS